MKILGSFPEIQRIHYANSGNSERLCQLMADNQEKHSGSKCRVIGLPHLRGETENADIRALQEIERHRMSQTTDIEADLHPEGICANS